MKDLYVQLAATGMAMAGTVLKNKDTNNTGTDDVIGNILTVGSGALLSFQAGDTHKTNAALKTIRDSIDAYLSTQGTWN